MHMEFVTQLYRDQVAEGRYFLHEHPQFASSWDLEFVKRVMQLLGVDRTRGDQCKYGAEALHGPMKGWPVMKPTGFMSNSLEILKALLKRCTGSRASASEGAAGTGTWCSRKQGGKHAPCAGSICREMAKYPRELCRAVISGFTAQLHADGRIRHRCYGIQTVDDDPDVQLLACGPEQGYSGKC